MRGQIRDLRCAHLHLVLKRASLEYKLPGRPDHAHIVRYQETLKVQDETLAARLKRAAQNLDTPASLCVENFNFT
jgi:hypothetical protein